MRLLLLLLLLGVMAAVCHGNAGEGEGAEESTQQKELLQPVEAETIAGSLGTREHAKELLREMGRRWDGMDSPVSDMNPWETVSSSGKGLNTVPGGNTAEAGSPLDPFNAKFGDYHDGPRGVPPSKMYTTFLFDSKHPWKRSTDASKATFDPAKPIEGAYHPLFAKETDGDIHNRQDLQQGVPGVPTVVVPIPRPLPERRGYDNNGLGRDRRPGDWLYEPLPNRPRISRPERMNWQEENAGTKHDYPAFEILNPRSLFSSHSPGVSREMANQQATSLLQTGEQEQVHVQAQAQEREGHLPYGRLGPAMFRNPAAATRGNRDSPFYPLSSRNDERRRLRERSFADKLTGEDPGPYGFGYTHQAEVAARLIPTPATLEVSSSQPSPNVNGAAGPEDAGELKMNEEPPIPPADDYPLELGPNPRNKMFTPPPEYEATKASSSLIAVSENARPTTAVTMRRMKERVHYASSSHRGNEEAAKRAHPVFVEEEAKLKAIPAAELVKTEDAEAEAEAEAEPKAESAATAAPATQDRASSSRKINSLLEVTADVVAKPPKHLTYELPLVKRAPHALRPREFVRSEEELREEEINGKASLVESGVSSKAVPDARPWWQRQDMRKENDARSASDATSPVNIVHAAPGKTLEGDNEHLPMPGDFVRGAPSLIVEKEAAHAKLAPALPRFRQELPQQQQQMQQMQQMQQTQQGFVPHFAVAPAGVYGDKPTLVPNSNQARSAVPIVLGV